MKIKDTFNIGEYCSLVDAIVKEFFDSDGEYSPHIGRLNVMRLFYNECVLDSKFDLPHDFSDALLLDVLVFDEEFISEFNNSLIGDGNIRLDFANAYKEAIDIVNTRKGTLGNAVSVIKKLFSDIVDMINPVLGKDNIENLTKLAENFANGNLTADTIIEVFKNKER